MEERKENVLLLNMSTFGGGKEPTDTNYYYSVDKDNGYIFEGMGQLEGGTKYIISKLLADDEIIDRIVVTGSPETFDDTDKDTGNSAMDFYKKRIIGFLKGGADGETTDGEKICETVDEILKKIDSNNKETKNVEGAKNICSKRIINNKDFIKRLAAKYEHIGEDFIIEKRLEGIETKDVATIRDISEAILGKSHSVNVYMDIQGGDRSFMYVLNALMTLNGEDRINVKAAVSTKYRRENVVNEITNSIDSFRLIEFITAMETFTSFGRGDLLAKYFTDKGYDNSSKERLLVETIKRISDAIQINDPTGLTEAFGSLRLILNSVKQFDDTFLEYVRSRIEEDYGEELLRTVNEEKVFEVAKKNLDIIDWCIRKGFIQQGLTLIEDKMPDFFFNPNVINVKVEFEKISTGNVKAYEKGIKDITGAAWYESLTNAKFYKLIHPIIKTESEKYRDRIIKKIVEDLANKIEGDKLIEYVRNNDSEKDKLLRKVLREMTIEYNKDIDLDLSEIAMFSIEYIENHTEDAMHYKGFKSLKEKLLGGIDKNHPCDINQIRSKMKGYISTKTTVPFSGSLKSSEYVQIEDNLVKNKKPGNQKSIVEMIKRSFSGDLNEDRAVRYYMEEKKKLVIPNDETIVQYCRSIVADTIYVLLIDVNSANEYEKKFLSDYFGIKSTSKDYNYAIDCMAKEWLKEDAELLNKYGNETHKYEITKANVSSIKDQLEKEYKSSDREIVEKYILFREIEGRIERKEAASEDVDKDSLENIGRYEVMQILQTNISDHIEFGLKAENKALMSWAGLKPNENYSNTKKVKNMLYKYNVIGEINKRIESRAEELDLLLRLHEALKQERNNSNHASERGLRLELNVVEQMMRIYVDMCRKYIVEPLS